MSIYCIFDISFLSPLWKGCDPSFKQSLFPFTKDALCQVSSLVEFGWVVSWKEDFKLRQCIFYISLLSPLEKRRDPSFWIPTTQNALCQGLVKIVSAVLEKKWKCEKFADRQMDSKQSEKLTRASAKVS